MEVVVLAQQDLDVLGPLAVGAVGGGEDPLGGDEGAAAELRFSTGRHDGRHPGVGVHLFQTASGKHGAVVDLIGNSVEPSPTVCRLTHRSLHPAHNPGGFLHSAFAARRVTCAD